jgi:AcrR family transcriptional regulator
MEDLARSAGVTKPILYRHFGHRDGLTAALATRFARGLEATLQAAMIAGNAPRETLEKTIDAYLEFVERDPEVYRFLVRRLIASPPDDELSVGNFLRQVANQVALVLGEQLRAAGLDSGGAEPLAHGMVGMVHAAGDWWLERRTMPRSRLVQYIVEVLWGGLAGIGLGTGEERS